MAKLAFGESEDEDSPSANNLSCQPVQLMSLLDQNLAAGPEAQLGSYAYPVRVQSSAKLSDHSCTLSGSAAKLLGFGLAQTVMLYNGLHTAESTEQSSSDTPHVQQAKQDCIYIRMLLDNGTGMHQCSAFALW